jgi:hypothetical protein
MDLNELLYRQQVAQIHANGALTSAALQQHRERVESYALRIARLRRALGAGASL